MSAQVKSTPRPVPIKRVGAEVRQNRQSDRVIGLLLKVCEALNTPKSVAVYMLAAAGEWAQLVSMRVNPFDYLDTVSSAKRLKADLLCVEFCRKYDGLPVTDPETGVEIDKAEKSYKAMVETEAQCQKTNSFLRLLDYPSRRDPPVYDYIRSVLLRMKKKIASVLGPLPGSLDFTFGPGTVAEWEGRKRGPTLADKLVVTPCVTAGAEFIFCSVLDASFWGKERSRLGLPHHEVVRGSRITSVPKDATIDRGIEIQPAGNIYLQLGVGRYMKRRLTVWGLPLNGHFEPHCLSEWRSDKQHADCQLRHRKMAREASLSGGWATIDLSSASDTVAYELVKWVLPEDWFMVLDQLRCSHTLCPDGAYRGLERFSSMGNGFTFELQTLIFSALVWAVSECVPGDGRDCFSVFGDDIIVPTRHANRVVEMLEYLGFRTNVRKTFVTGLFKESCGGDYFCGLDVRAIYVKNTDSPLTWISLHNSLKRWVWPGSLYRFLRCLQACVQAVPVNLRRAGPQWLGDVVFHRPLKDRACRTIYRYDSGYQAHFIRAVVAIPEKLRLDRWDDSLYYLLAVGGVPSVGVAIRNSVRGHRTIWLWAGHFQSGRD